MNIEKGSTFEQYRSVGFQVESRASQEIVVPRERQEVGTLAHGMVADDGPRTMTLASGNEPEINDRGDRFYRFVNSTPMVWLRAAFGTGVDLLFIMAFYTGYAAAMTAAGGAVSPLLLPIMGAITVVWGMYRRIKRIRESQK